MPELGELITETLQVDPFDLTTAVSILVTGPDGTSVTVGAPTTIDSGHTWSTVITYNQVGVWHLAWTITGTGAGVRTRSVLIDASYALPAWSPTRPTVADYVPGRTLVGAVDGYGSALGTFDDTTHPTGVQVDRLIVSACAWVSVRTGPVDLTLYHAATAVAAMYCAWAVEQGWPDNSREQPIADSLWQRANAMRDDLAAANEAATGVDPVDPFAHLMPVYYFPDPRVQSPWGDTTFL